MVVGLKLVDVLELVEELVVDVLVVTVPQGVGHVRVTFWPTAFLRHSSASPAVAPPAPFVSHTQIGSHVLAPIAVRKMNRQSAAVGVWPELTG